MASNEEKQRRKTLLAQVKQSQKAKEEAVLPLPQPDIKALFDYVNSRLEADGCDDTLRYSRAFLSGRGIRPEPFVAWLQEYGGYCDCEVIANVEGTWGERVGSMYKPGREVTLQTGNIGNTV